MGRGAEALAIAGALATGPRPAGSPAADAAQDLVAAELAARGWAPRRAPGPEGAVWACRPGTGSERVLVLLAHTDSVAEGPGASDDAAAVGVLLTAAAAMGAPVRTTCLVFPDAEERGLRGSRRFVDDPALLPGPVDLAVSLELVGRGVPTWSGLGKAWDGPRLRALLAAAPAEAPLVYRAVSWRFPRLERSDHAWWGLAGVPSALLLGRGPRGFDPAYHTADDVPATLEEPALEAAVSLVLGLAAAPPLPAASGPDPAALVAGVWVPGPAVRAAPWLLLAAGAIACARLPGRWVGGGAIAACAGLGGAAGLPFGPLAGWVGWLVGAVLARALLGAPGPAAVARGAWGLCAAGAAAVVALDAPMLALPLGAAGLAAGLAPRVPSGRRALLAPLAGWPAFFFVRPNAVDELAFHHLVPDPANGGLGPWAAALALLAAPLLALAPDPPPSAAPGPRPA